MATQATINVDTGGVARNMAIDEKFNEHVRAFTEFLDDDVLSI